MILAADLHFRWDKPPCRKETLEEWIEVQFSKFQFILNGTGPILVAGDFFHKPTGAPAWMFQRLIQMIKESEQTVVAIPGQHDLPYHQADLFHQSNLGVLAASGAVRAELLTDSVDCFAWPGMKYPLSKYEKGRTAITHQMVISSAKGELWPGQSREAGVSTAEQLLRRFPQYELIVSGDNHQPFAYQFRGRWLINPGSMTRQRSNEKHLPGFFIYHDNGQVERAEFPDIHEIQDVPDAPNFSDSMLGANPEAVQELMDGLEAGDEEDFPSALQSYFLKHNVREAIQRRIQG